MIPIIGACCIVTSLYCPENKAQIFGGYGNFVAGCLEYEFSICKVAVEAPKEGDPDKDLCFCMERSCILVKPTTCLAGSAQCFCLDCRCGFPCNEQVPCVLNTCGLTCLINYEPSGKCCVKIGELLPKLIEKPVLPSRAQLSAQQSARPAVQQPSALIPQNAAYGQRQPQFAPVMIVQPAPAPAPIYVINNQQPLQPVYLQPPQPVVVMAPPQPQVYIVQQPTVSYGKRTSPSLLLL